MMLDVLFIWVVILLYVAQKMARRRLGFLYELRGNLVSALAVFLVSPFGPLHDAPKETKATVVFWGVACLFYCEFEDRQKREEEDAENTRRFYEQELETRLDKLEKRAARKRRSRSPARRSH
jgi:hypothetical protein